MGIKERKEREKVQRRNDIIDSAERVFFENGLENATMDTIAKEAELSKPTLYLYFKSKDDLYIAVSSRGLKILLDLHKKYMKQGLSGFDKFKQSIVGADYEFYDKHPKYFKLLSYYDYFKIDINPEHSESSKEFIKYNSEIFKMCIDAFEQGIKDGTIREDLDPYKITVMLSLAVCSIMNKFPKGSKSVSSNIKSAKEIIDYSIDLLLYTIKKQ